MFAVCTQQCGQELWTCSAWHGAGVYAWWGASRAASGRAGLAGICQLAVGLLAGICDAQRQGQAWGD